jgi:ATP-dependent DNA ligase
MPTQPPNLQRAVNKASRQLGISVLPHELKLDGYRAQAIKTDNQVRLIYRNR